MANPSPPLGTEREMLWGDLAGEYRKAAERVRTKGGADRDIRRVATARDQHPPDARHVVACVKRVPLAAQIGFEPSREIHRSIGYRHSNIAEIAGAIASRDVHAATERDRQVSKVPANAGAIAVTLPSGSGGAGVFVAEC